MDDDNGITILFLYNILLGMKVLYHITKYTLLMSCTYSSSRSEKVCSSGSHDAFRGKSLLQNRELHWKSKFIY
jgi:hypothetical protein